MKKCPYCAEEIQDEAIFCKHCKKDLAVPKPDKEEVKEKETIVCPYCGKDPFASTGKLWMDKKCTKCGKELPLSIVMGKKTEDLPAGMAIKCPACSHVGLVGDFNDNFSGCLFIILLCIGIVPGIIYLLIVQGKKKCPNCGKVF